ncbi:MAG: hypothetical protein KGS61_03270, partial [Verrucomicrobia bacterium]|nr:hypothetical protein [Verrucomicrobiota bacterium]
EAAKRNKLLSYWCRLFESLSYSPQDLYTSVLANLSLRDVPALETTGVKYRQSGLFSPERLYLQLRRERLVFEICGAPFGTGFFVSSRLFDRHREPTLLDYLVIFAVLSFMGAFTGFQYGWTWSLIETTGMIALAWSLMRLGVALPVDSVDRVLSDLPCIGPVYDLLFHPDTYYRQDLNHCYREAVHNALMQAIDGIVNEKGLKPLSGEERRPTLRSLDRP